MSVSTQVTRPVRDHGTTGAVRRAGLVAWVCLLIVYVLWGSTYLAIRVGVETMPPLLMAAARQLLAAAIMLPVALRAQRKQGHPWPSRAEWRGRGCGGTLLLVATAAVGLGRRALPPPRPPRPHVPPALCPPPPTPAPNP